MVGMAGGSGRELGRVVITHERNQAERREGGHIKEASPT